MKKKLSNVKILLLAAAASLTTMATAAGAYLLLPSGYLALDINPSIELHTNRLNYVTSITGINADAKKLLEGYQLRDRDLDDVIEDLVDRMVLQGYLGQSSDAQLLVTADEASVKPETLARVNTHISEYLDYRRVEANVLAQSVPVNKDLRERAAAQQISAGKMSVIDRLIANDPTLRPEDLSDTTVSDLVAAAKARNISLHLLEDRLDDLDDRQPNAAHGNPADRLEEEIDALDDKNDMDHMDDWNRLPTGGADAVSSATAAAAARPSAQPGTAIQAPPVHYDDDFYDDHDDWDDYDDHDDWDDHDDRHDDHDDWDDDWDDRYDD